MSCLRRLLPGAFLCLAAAPALAVPRVAVDITPIHSIVARVMAGVGTPELVLPPGTSPHDYALQPSRAALLQGADLVVWVGPELSPWMEAPIEALSSHATTLELETLPGVALLPVRVGGRSSPMPTSRRRSRARRGRTGISGSIRRTRLRSRRGWRPS